MSIQKTLLVGKNVLKYIKLGSLVAIISLTSACTRIAMSDEPAETVQTPTPSTANSDFLSQALEAAVPTLIDTTEEDGEVGERKGAAVARFTDGVYELKAEVDSLPVPPVNQHYEGWVVQSSTGERISTGEVVPLEDSSYYLNFMTTNDLTTHDLFVITLESSDPATNPSQPVVKGPITIL